MRKRTTAKAILSASVDVDVLTILKHNESNVSHVVNNILRNYIKVKYENIGDINDNDNTENELIDIDANIQQLIVKKSELQQRQSVKDHNKKTELERVTDETKTKIHIWKQLRGV